MRTYSKKANMLLCIPVAKQNIMTAEFGHVKATNLQIELVSKLFS
ncbi:hypothetical protein NSQ37_15135 [Bacillus sp. FSL P4-0334]|nr:hypothetical protein [Bacillus velezensis]